MTKSFGIYLIVVLSLHLSFFAYSQTESDIQWKASWISENFSQNTSNSWYCFRKSFRIAAVPKQAVARIAVDSKYWMWINGDLVVFEGGLKRGPNPNDTYYDELDLAPFLCEGDNTIAILVWYFGKDGFSHHSSGKAGLLFECVSPEVEILSDKSWKAILHPAYETGSLPFPNFRLPESNIRFDARCDIKNWIDQRYNDQWWGNAREWGVPPVFPWNELHKRTIPFWKTSLLNDYENTIHFPFDSDGDTIVCRLSANLQITPYLKIESIAGKSIDIQTDNYRGGGQINLRAEYVTCDGVQEYESYGWLNGHQVIYIIPKGVRVLDLKYRETGFDTEFAGNFHCSDDFLNRLWEKSRRTLYVTMRDTYMDCPDRERAQWWGDEVNEGGEAFYALCPKSHSLFRKGMYELIGWQRSDSTLFSPVPAGNWNTELPCQMLSSIGYYGFWNYYLHTGDRQTIADLYPGVRKYLHVWKTHPDGTVIFRPGEWTWGDWGDNRDLELIYNALYYLALKGALNMAGVLGKNEDVLEYSKIMSRLKNAYNRQFWTGSCYRHPAYRGMTDDRSQALAVVSGLADSDKYPALLETLKKEEHASPYMEKYVLEALFMMGYDEYALFRMKKRFAEMVNHPLFTTLFEGWGIGANGFGGGTNNHAWSGGGLTLLSQYLCGISPLEPAYSRIGIFPHPSAIKSAAATVLSVKGVIQSSFLQKTNEFILDVIIPEGTVTELGIPEEAVELVRANNQIVWEKNKNQRKSLSGIKFLFRANGYLVFEAQPGMWSFSASKK